MHGLEACLFKYISVAAFRIYDMHSEDGAKRGGWMLCMYYIVMEITLLIIEIMEKSWNCVF